MTFIVTFIGDAGEFYLERTFTDDIANISKIAAVRSILDVVCRTTGMGFSAVARVTERRWIACAVRDDIAFGLEPGGELDLKTTICDEIRRSGNLVAIDHVSTDKHFCTHPTPAMYGFQSYISVPIKYPDGRFFGTLCAIDPRPARVDTPETIGMFTLFADLIGFHLDAHERLAASARALSDEKEHAELREQFIAVLGHDLRNPLAAVQTGAELLRAMPLPANAVRIATVMAGSARRMSSLVENTLDFARGRLGGGLPLTMRTVDDLDTILEHGVSELQAAWPERRIETTYALRAPVMCDPARIGQLFSNLLANALTHGDPGGPVAVRATSHAVGFELSVANRGPAIPTERFVDLFKPFARGSAGAGSKGLGLGLFIASEIARAHEGTLDVASTPEETRFTFRMPRRGE
jgi:signal transduction histidine kinase